MTTQNENTNTCKECKKEEKLVDNGLCQRCLDKSQETANEEPQAIKPNNTTETTCCHANQHEKSLITGVGGPLALLLIGLVAGLAIMNGHNSEQKTKQEKTLHAAEARAEKYKTQLQDTRRSNEKPVNFTTKYEERDGETEIQNTTPIMVIKREDPEGFPFWIIFKSKVSEGIGEEPFIRKFMDENKKGITALRKHLAENGPFEWNNMKPEEETLVDTAGLGKTKIYTR